jgi:hypothetical protein
MVGVRHSVFYVEVGWRGNNGEVGVFFHTEYNKMDRM